MCVGLDTSSVNPVVWRSVQLAIVSCQTRPVRGGSPGNIGLFGYSPSEGRALNSDLRVILI